MSMSTIEQTNQLKELLHRVNELEKLIHERLVPELEDQDKRLDDHDELFKELKQKGDTMLELLRQVASEQRRTQFDPVLLQSVDKKLNVVMTELRGHIDWEEAGRPPKLGGSRE